MASLLGSLRPSGDTLGQLQYHPVLLEDVRQTAITQQAQSAVIYADDIASQSKGHKLDIRLGSACLGTGSKLCKIRSGSMQATMMACHQMQCHAMSPGERHSKCSCRTLINIYPRPVLTVASLLQVGPQRRTPSPV
jgi:hypothetical protein